MVVISCDDGSSGGGDSALNGTWVSSGMELKLNNGSWEIASDGTTYYKGNYTATPSTGSITVTMTQVNGAITGGVLESRWYTKADLKASPLYGTTLTDADLDMLFASQTGIYSVTASTLNLKNLGGFFEGIPTQYTKKQQ